MNRRWLYLVPLLVIMAACDKEKEVDPPAELVEFKPRIKVDEVWSTGVGGDADALRLGLRAATDGQFLYAASHDGDVFAYELKSGRTKWRTDTKVALSGGPGLGGGLLVVGSAKGDVIALEATSGTQRWRVHVNGEVIAPPAASDKVVVVRSVDGHLRGLDAADGHEVWSTEQQVPRLSLRGTASPVIAGNSVICGFDNGKVVAADLGTGDVQWETPVTSSRGRTELERLVDIDSPVQVVDKDVFVTGFGTPGRAAMLALDSGQVWWQRDYSGDRGLAVGDENIYLSTSEGDVVALRKKDGTEVWKQSAMHRRSLSGPVIDGNVIVVADIEGYVHWLDAATGDLLARTRVGSVRVTNAPLAAGGMVFVLNDGGQLAAFRRIEGAGARG